MQKFKFYDQSRLLTLVFLMLKIVFHNLIDTTDPEWLSISLTMQLA